MVPLDELRQGHSSEAQTALRSLQERGFCWLDVDERTLRAATPALAAAGMFLAGEGLGSGARHALEGHFSAALKDGLRVVTGQCLGQPSAEGPGLDGLAGALPEGCREAVQALATALDEAQRDVVEALAAVSKGYKTAEEVGVCCDVPLLKGKNADLPSYALLDIVRYHEGAPDEVVASHSDPGLLVLSLPCSVPGLQLRNEKGEWLSPPDGCGVLWAGEAGRHLNWRPGVHRVVASYDREPRLSAWHELCTSAQLAPPLLGLMESRGLELRLGDMRGTAAVLQQLQAAEDRQETAVRDAVLAFRMGVPVGKLALEWAIGFEALRSDELEEMADFPGKEHLKDADEERRLPPGLVEIVRKRAV